VRWTDDSNREDEMESLIHLAGQIAKPLLRFSLGLVLVWIGALKFADPSPVVGLLDASLSFLAFDGFVYLLAVLEVGAGILLFLGVATRWVSLGLAGLFAGTLLIFLIAPAVSYGEAGFPFLTLAGEFLLKDVVLLAAAVALLSLTEEAAARDAAAPR
jgi:uncharacterized membrane protein YkgB